MTAPDLDANPNPDASQQQASAQRDPTTSSGRRVLHGLLQGIVGGLIATALMTLYRFPVFRALPPTSDFWAKYIGSDDTEAYPGTGMVLHFLYGGAAGGMFGVGISLLDLQSDRKGGLIAIGLSLLYGLALSVFGSRIIFPYLLSKEAESAESAIFHVGHAIYGLTLGTWIGFRERRGEVYE